MLALIEGIDRKVFNKINLGRERRRRARICGWPRPIDGCTGNGHTDGIGARLEVSATELAPPSADRQPANLGETYTVKLSKFVIAVRPIE